MARKMTQAEQRMLALSAVRGELRHRGMAPETLSAVEFLELCGRLHEVEEDALQNRINTFLETFSLSGQKRSRLGSFSKGMRQKVLISAAMLHDPSVLILDEPLTGLDVESVMLTKSLLTSLESNGKAVLYSSHVLDVVERFCHRVLILDQGKLIADGSPGELKARTKEMPTQGGGRCAPLP